jgi:hypothetical protein
MEMKKENVVRFVNVGTHGHIIIASNQHGTSFHTLKWSFYSIKKEYEVGILHAHVNVVPSYLASSHPAMSYVTNVETSSRGK